jgi:transforming growth factor-beta-induced protein
MFKSLAFAVIAVVGFSSVASSSTSSFVAPPMHADPPTQTIKALAVSSPQFSTLVKALVKVNLADVFDGSANYTVFAPTNAAFDAAAKAFNVADGPALVEALDAATLTAILKYHVTGGSRDAASVLSAGELTMLDNNTAKVSAQGGAAKVEGATITKTDIRATNGYIHVIDGVILPPSLRK